MMLKRYKALKTLMLLFALFSWSPYTLKAQTDNKGMQAGKPFESKSSLSSSIKQKMFVGGNVGFQAASGFTSFTVAPVLGYRISDDFAVGIGSSYLYFREKIISPTYTYNFSTHVFGGSVFARYFVFENIFAHAEYEVLNLKTYDSFNERRNIGNWLVGGGYMQQLGPHFASNLSVLYALNQSPYSPYGSPLIIRPGFLYLF